MIKKLIKSLKSNIKRVLVLFCLYLIIGGLYLNNYINSTILIIADFVFGLITIIFSDHFDTYKSNKYKNQFLMALGIALVIFLLISFVLVFLDMDISDFRGFKSISFNIYILVLAYMISLLIKEIKFYIDK